MGKSSAMGKPLGDEQFERLLALGRSVLAQVVIVIVQGDDGLAAGLV